MTASFQQALKEAQRPSWGRINRARLKSVIKAAGKTILDVGCSTGEYVQKLSQEGYHIFGVDILFNPQWSTQPIKRIACADALNLPFPAQSFDTILAFEVLEHLPNASEVIDEFHRLCRKNLLISVPNCDLPSEFLTAGLVYSHWLDRTHCNFFTPQTLSKFLETHGFKIQEIKLINRVFPDYPVLRSFHIPHKVAYGISRILSRIPIRKQFFITILACAERLPAG